MYEIVPCNHNGERFMFNVVPGNYNGDGLCMRLYTTTMRSIGSGLFGWEIEKL